MLKTLSIFILISTAFLSFAIFSSYSKDQDVAMTAGSDGNALPQIIRSVDLNKDFSFAEEALPMDNFDTRERLDRELMRNTYWHSNTALNIKKMKRFFPVIEGILMKNGIPDDFKYLAVAESDLSNATSPAGAKGFWQFLKATGESYGLEINAEVDERFHLEKATEAACKHIRQLRDRFGSWTMAAAAYNMGGTKLSKEVELQRTTYYYDMNLNEETSRYIFRIVAMKEILENPGTFGFQIDESEKYPALDKVINIRVDTQVENWGEFAKEHGLSYRMLKVFNPWLLTHQLTNRSKKTYLVKIPAK